MKCVYNSYLVFERNDSLELQCGRIVKHEHGSQADKIIDAYMTVFRQLAEIVSKVWSELKRIAQRLIELGVPVENSTPKIKYDVPRNIPLHSQVLNNKPLDLPRIRRFC